MLASSHRFPFPRQALSTGVLTKLTQFVLWSLAYLSARYAWSLRVRLLVGGPAILLAIWELLAPIEIAVRSPIAHQLSIALRLATLGMILLLMFATVRDRDGTYRAPPG